MRPEDPGLFAGPAGEVVPADAVREAGVVPVIGPAGRPPETVSSSTTVCRPSDAAYTADARPAGPTMAISHWLMPLRVVPPTASTIRAAVGSTIV